jgi:membrane fusion protein, heavy metal efflux system
MTLPKIRAATIGCPLLLALALASCSKRAESVEANAEPPAASSNAITVAGDLIDRGRIATVVVERSVPSGVLEVPGEIRSGEGDEAIVGSLVAGRVTDLKVGVGDRVSRDQILALVQAPEVARLRAEARRSEARLAVSVRALARLRELESEGATSAASIEHAQAEVSGARAELDAARTQLAGLGLRVEPEKANAADTGALLPSHVLLRSPIDGVVAERKTVLGTSVSPGDALYRVVTTSSRVVLAHVPEARVSEVDLGAKAVVRAREHAAGAGEPCDGTAERATTLVDEDRTVLVRVRLDEGCTLKTAGRSLTVGLTLANAETRAPVLLVPVAAVVELRGKHVVFVQARDRNAFVWRAVRLGAPFGDRVAVEDGVQEGERVVVRGTVLLKGEVVRAEPIE